MLVVTIAVTITIAKKVGQLHSVTVKRIDFCDPQGAKGACVRKAASIKFHMKIYLNSRNNIETSEEMKETIQSFGGMSSVRVTSCGPPTVATFSNVKLEGVSSISSKEYNDKGMRVGKAYKIGQGRTFLKFQEFRA